jgi:peptide/nickel transport system permease protein
MLNYFIRRLLYTVPILLGITLIVFLLFQVAGGDPVYRLLGKNASALEVSRLAHQLALDRPLWWRYLHFLGDLMRLDFGRSWETKQRVTEMIAQGLGPSLALAVPAFILGTLAALATATTAALFRRRLPDRLLIVISVMGMSVSILALIIGAQYLFAYRFDLFPISGYESGLRGVPYLVLPILIWIASQLGGDVRFYRAVILEEMGRDYVVTARAKGLSMRQAVTRHVLKNALIPITTRMMTEIPLLFTGSLLLENYFGIPGLGNAIIRGVNAGDFPVIQAFTLFGSAVYIFFNLLGDLVYAMVDPRVKLQ